VLNRFKKNKKNIKILLKATMSRWNGSWKLSDKCTKDILPQKQKSATIEVAILYIALTGREEQIKCLEKKCDLNGSDY